jgi:hypothetical protein
VASDPFRHRHFGLNTATAAEFFHQARRRGPFDPPACQCRGDFLIGPIAGHQAPGKLDIRLQDSFSHGDAALFVWEESEAVWAGGSQQNHWLHWLSSAASRLSKQI